MILIFFNIMSPNLSSHHHIRWWKLWVGQILWNRGPTLQFC